MARVRVVSELVETDGSETEEFSADAPDMASAVALMLANEEKVAHEEWMSWVAFKSGFCFDESGFTFSIYDDGSGVN